MMGASNNKEKNMKKLSALLVLVSALLISACMVKDPPLQIKSAETGVASSVTPTVFPTHTSTPEPTVTATLIPVIRETVELDDGSGVSFSVPTGWFTSKTGNGITLANNETTIYDPFKEIFESGDCKIVLFVTSRDIQNSMEVQGDPILGIASFTLFSGINVPDKESASMIELAGKDFAFGVYSSDEIKQNHTPLFVAMHFSQTNTVVFMLYASSNDEEMFQPIFDDLLSSIETY